jgi:hypothetical protein
MKWNMLTMLKIKMIISCVWWLVSIILATWEAEIRRIMVPGLYGHKV